MARQFIYHMQELSKTYPGNRKVLDNVYLQFYPDAKIGVLGVNGAGKSTLLRIMAGIDKEYSGEAWVAQGARVGYLAQEPQLDPEKSVRDNVMEGVAPQKAIVISTHILEEVDAVCSRAIIIAAGRVVADETPAELQRRHPSGKLDDVFRRLTMESA